jgi:hypothetical protein
MVATQKAKLESVEFNLQDMTNSHLKEKQVVFGKMKDLRAEADASEAASMKSRAELKEVSARFDKLRFETSDYKEVCEAKKRFEIESITLQAGLDKSKATLVGVSASLSKADEDIMVLRKQAIANTTSIAKAGAEIEELNVSVLKVTKVSEQAEARYEKTQGFLDDLRKEFAKVESAKNSLAIDLSVQEENMSREMEQMEGRQSALRAQNNKLTTDLSKARDSNDSLRTKLELENPDALNDVHEEEVFRLQVHCAIDSILHGVILCGVILYGVMLYYIIYIVTSEIKQYDNIFTTIFTTTPRTS